MRSRPRGADAQSAWPAADGAAPLPCRPSISLAGAVCLPGYGRIGNSTNCDLCLINIFSPGGTATNGKPPCAPCPAGTYTEDLGSTQCQKGM